MLALKENQANRYQDTVALFGHAQQTDFRDMDSDYAKTIEKIMVGLKFVNVGRLATRTAFPTYATPRRGRT